MIDNKDRKIISLLKQNARLSIRDIAKKEQLRPSTVHQRIQKLLREEIIEKFTLKLNNEKSGENFIAFLLITTKKDFSSAFFNNENIKEVFGITGEYDLILKLKFSDISQFNSYLINLRKNEAIEKTLTMVATTTIKEEI